MDLKEKHAINFLINVLEKKIKITLLKEFILLKNQGSLSGAPATKYLCKGNQRNIRKSFVI